MLSSNWTFANTPSHFWCPKTLSLPRVERTNNVKCWVLFSYNNNHYNHNTQLSLIMLISYRGNPWYVLLYVLLFLLIVRNIFVSVRIMRYQDYLTDIFAEFSQSWCYSRPPTPMAANSQILILYWTIRRQSIRQLRGSSEAKCWVNV